ncbi:precorrin-3B synthase [Mesorhizobium sp. 1B3]|uniref:precorrin-3B synthase n=1 Tax=Mesorhizobium sp. 1B3 TaxID=3243599 RepID=UPI003D96AE5E
MSLLRGACPTLAAPMETGDGLLARMHPVSGGVTPATLAAIAEAARRFGNGLLEVTARGSLQIRGLTGDSAPRFAAAVDALDISVRSGVPVETGPLAGLDPEEIIDPRPLADDIRERVAAVGLSQRLGPKVSVVVDGGGRLKLVALVADVRLEAAATDGAWRVAVGGTASTATVLGVVPAADVATTVVTLLETVAAKGRRARAKELSLEELRSTLPPSVLPDISPSRGEIGRPLGFRQSSIVRNAPASKLPISPLVGEMSGRTEGGNVEQSPIGIFPLSDARLALGIGLPFGQATATQIIGFAERAERHGVDEIRLAPGRALLALAPVAEAAVRLKEMASFIGFITDPADPRLSVVACAGAPACASGHIQARAIASEIAADAAAILGRGQLLHVSGCAKQCARPDRAAFTLVGTASGAELYSGDGTAGEPLARVANDAAADAFRRAGEFHRQEKNKRDKAAAAR